MQLDATLPGLIVERLVLVRISMRRSRSLQFLQRISIVRLPGLSWLCGRSAIVSEVALTVRLERNVDCRGQVSIPFTEASSDFQQRSPDVMRIVNELSAPMANCKHSRLHSGPPPPFVNIVFSWVKQGVMCFSVDFVHHVIDRVNAEISTLKDFIPF